MTETKKVMKTGFGKALTGLSLCLATILQPAWAETVCSVHDGDTFTTCSGIKVRLAGVDAPEIKQANGIYARDYLARITEGKDISLFCTGKSFQRQVCHVVIPAGGGSTLDLGREMVGRGWAFDSPKYSHGEYADAEDFAKSLHRGVWILPDGGLRPWDFRHHRTAP